MDEIVLVQECLRHAPEAMRRLIDRFQGEVFGLCFRLLNHRQDAEDVVQEVFLRVFRSLHRWDSSRPLRPWIMGIAVNRCRTWMSQRARRPEPVDYLQEMAGRSDSDDSLELVREIQTALQDIRPDYRIVFTLFHEQNLSCEAIAEMIGRPVGTVKTWLYRTRLELLDRLRRRGMVEDSDLPAEK